MRELTPAHTPLTYTLMHTQSEQTVLETEAEALAAKPNEPSIPPLERLNQDDPALGGTWATSQVSQHQN